MHSSRTTLYQVWGDPGYRQRGVGRLVLDAAIEWARDAGARAMELTVSLGAHSAIDFYRRAGFVEMGEPSPLRPGSDLLQQPMRRAI